MTKRIFRSISLAALGAMLAVVAIIIGVLYNFYIGEQKEQQWQQTELAAQGVAQNGMGYFEELELEQCRITWVAADGTVLYDNRVSAESLSNHNEREEITEALISGFGESVRNSDTLMEQTRYTAQRLPDGSVLRLAVSQNGILALLAQVFWPILVVVVAGAVLSLMLASRLSKKIVEPLNELDLNHPLSNEGYDEVAPLLHRIESQQREIRKQSGMLHQRRREFETITNNMDEGLVLLNEKNKILTMNASASRMLESDGDYTGKDILALDRSEAMLDLLLTARRGKGAERITEKNGRQYRIEANPVFSQGFFSGVALLIMDVTEREQAERLRREFTANVSHELKTPLHTISGCAELLSNGMVKPGDEKGFSNQIYTEAQRMIHLVDDIIGLSRLDEGAEDMQREEVDLYALAQEVAGRFAPTAEEAKVSLSVQGGQATVVGIRRMLDTLISNLCSNAIKYNRPGGRVDITVEAAQREAKLTVADNGIGIPTEHQSRVFERFYRVDKSRSKAVGGTGLGLSIVKHAALVHDAKIQMESQPEKGTAITVIFPR